MRAWRLCFGVLVACSHAPAAPSSPEPGSGAMRLELVAGAVGGWGTADGTGTNARFGNIGQLEIAGGKLYAPSHDRVRVIELATAAVTTERSDGGLDLFGIASDATGELYAADDVAQAIFRREAATATWVPFAGATGEAGDADGALADARFDGPMSLASDRGHVLFIGEAGGKSIRALDLATGMVATLATGLDGDPIALAYDGAGTLYIAERETSVIRTLDVATGTLGWFAGQPGTSGGNDGEAATATFDGPDALALDGRGALWVSDGLGETVRRIDLATRQVTTMLGSFRIGGAQDASGPDASFNLVTGLAIDGGWLYIADSGNGEVRRANTATLAVDTWAGSIAHPGSADGVAGMARFQVPRGLALASDGRLYVADSQNGAIRRIDPASGAVTTPAVTEAGLPRGLAYPVGVAARGQTLIVAELGASDLVAIDLPTSTLTRLAGTPFQPGHRDGSLRDALFAHPQSLAFDGVNRLAISDLDPQTGGPALRTIDLTAGTVGTLSVDTALADVGGLTFFGDDLLVSDSVNDTIWRIALGTGHADALAHVPAPGALDIDTAGVLYVAASDGTVRAIALSTGDTTTVAGRSGSLGCVPGPLPGGLNVPAGLAADASGALYISDSAENAVLVAR